MIDPPNTIGDCRKIYNAAGLRVDELMDMQFFPNAAKLAEILNELEALRAIAKELAASNPFATRDYECFFCGKHEPGHEEGCLYEKACLIERAKQMVKA